MAATATEIEDFLSGPLVSWLSTCLKKPEKTLSVYDSLFDGKAINEVLLQIDPEPSHPLPNAQALHGLTPAAQRIRTFHSIVRILKALYEEELGQIIIKLPDCICLGRNPNSRKALEEMKLLLLLLLGCAVQGPTKETFITRIKELPLEIQHDIVECIKLVTDSQSVVLTLDWTEQPPERLYLHLRSLVAERDTNLQRWIEEVSNETRGNSSNSASSTTQATPVQEAVESNHLAVELADWKARLRKQRQDFEEKSEALAECKEELEHANMLLAKYRNENSDLLVEARRAKAYRDELDAMRERAERADRLENEALRYRERLADAEFYKVRVDELREDNRVLLETQEMLEAQLAHSRQRADHVLELEAELLGCKQTINDLSLERDAAKEKIQELIDENIQLENVTKASLQQHNQTVNPPDSESDDNEDVSFGDSSLSEQLTTNAQARALKLELENKKLLSTIDSLKEKHFRDTSNNILELEKERKKLTLKCEQLQENCDRLQQQNAELETVFKSALLDNRKLQDSLDSNKSLMERQSAELTMDKKKLEEIEANMEAMNKEKARLQGTSDAYWKRAEDAEKMLLQISEDFKTVKAAAEKSEVLEKLNTEYKDRIGALEKETTGVQKEIAKLKEIIETKDVNLDQQATQTEKQNKEIGRLIKENENLTSTVEKLQEFEQKAQELLSQTTVYTETISTLQNDLVSAKLLNEKVKTCLDKLGWNFDILDNEINVLVEKLMANPEVCKQILQKAKEQLQGEQVCQKCAAFSATAEAEQMIKEKFDKLNGVNQCLQSENAKLQVELATLASQVNSLTAQQIALQLANSQLVAEKEELVKQQESDSTEHKTLLLDQVTLRCLHEQLSSEYETLMMEQETLKKANRDLRSEVRGMKESQTTLEKKLNNIEVEKEVLKNESKNLGNLRAEHSKLKDDFRNLFTASERLKTEYRNLQEEYRKLRSESGRLKLGHTEMQGELNTRSDLLTGLTLDNQKLQQRCDMLLEMNQTLDSDRRALMDHVSQILSQYHSLLTHSLEDKQHYHHEEKVFTDKLNNLCRQKEKLEEKIMEHYRKLDSCSTKKKSFGATFVKRVKKASSDIINKVPSRNRRSWHADSTMNQSTFMLGGSGESDSDNSAIDDHQQTPGTVDSTFNRSSASLFEQKSRTEDGSLRRSQRDQSLYASRDGAASTGSALSLGAVGTRRTVYLAEEEESPIAAVPKPEVQPLLVYNRISTVLNDPQQIAAMSNNSRTNPDEPSSMTAAINLQDINPDLKRTGSATQNDPKESAIWYEYGCV